MLLAIEMTGNESSRRRSDADVAYDVENALMWSTEVPAKTIRARVQDQWVWLVGECDFDHQRAAAEHAIAHVAGLKGVVNSIHVKHT